MWTKAQQIWLDANPQYQSVGDPRPDVHFIEVGTLYADGEFEKMQAMKSIKLEPGCRCVGIKVHPKT